MLLWSLALAITAIACAALYYAGAGRRVNVTDGSVDSPEMAHLRQQLREIEDDQASGRLGEAEAVAAKAELARETLRLKGESRPIAEITASGRRLVTVISVAATALLAGLTYAVLGNPDMPSMPLATRPDAAVANLTLDDAVAKIEARLKQAPDDIKGWKVVAPAYMQMGRYAEAADALRRVLKAEGPSADRETDLGEALMMQNGGKAEGEAMDLFKSAAALDPTHVRSRYYIAGELTRTGQYEAAKAAWADLIKLGKGDENWLPAAREGLAIAENNGVAPAQAMPDQSAIEGMVEGLSTRLFDGGGTIDEWTRLVRSRLVLHQTAEAQKAYDAARAAYPDASVRTELDVLAADNGLVAGK